MVFELHCTKRIARFSKTFAVVVEAKLNNIYSVLEKGVRTRVEIYINRVYYDSSFYGMYSFFFFFFALNYKTKSFYLHSIHIINYNHMNKEMKTSQKQLSVTDSARNIRINQQALCIYHINLCYLRLGYFYIYMYLHLNVFHKIIVPRKEASDIYIYTYKICHAFPAV